MWKLLIHVMKSNTFLCRKNHCSVNFDPRDSHHIFVTKIIVKQSQLWCDPTFVDHVSSKSRKNTENLWPNARNFLCELCSHHVWRLQIHEMNAVKKVRVNNMCLTEGKFDFKCRCECCSNLTKKTHAGNFVPMAGCMWEIWMCKKSFTDERWTKQCY
jgi:hypothetical protein